MSLPLVFPAYCVTESVSSFADVLIIFKLNWKQISLKFWLLKFLLRNVVYLCRLCWEPSPLSSFLHQITSVRFLVAGSELICLFMTKITSDKLKLWQKGDHKGKNSKFSGISSCVVISTSDVNWVNATKYQINLSRKLMLSCQCVDSTRLWNLGLLQPNRLPCSCSIAKNETFYFAEHFLWPLKEPQNEILNILLLNVLDLVVLADNKLDPTVPEGLWRPTKTRLNRFPSTECL